MKENLLNNHLKTIGVKPSHIWIDSVVRRDDVAHLEFFIKDHPINKKLHGMKKVLKKHNIKMKDIKEISLIFKSAYDNTMMLVLNHQQPTPDTLSYLRNRRVIIRSNIRDKFEIALATRISIARSRMQALCPHFNQEDHCIIDGEDYGDCLDRLSDCPYVNGDFPEATWRIP